MEPAGLLAVWAAGLSAAAALVIHWRIVGRGYAWLALGVVAGCAAGAALAGAGTPAWLGAGLAVVALGVAGNPTAASVAAGAAAVSLGIATGGNAAHIVSAAVFLGGVTSEMLLGHWYLVDPRLPRSALRMLDTLAIVGAVADLVVLTLLGVFPWPESDFLVGLGWMLLLGTTLLLMVAVRFALKEQGYSGVMAATGLSYLAVLTALGAVFLGRSLLEGGVLG